MKPNWFCHVGFVGQAVLLFLLLGQRLKLDSMRHMFLTVKLQLVRKCPILYRTYPSGLRDKTRSCKIEMRVRISPGVFNYDKSLMCCHVALHH